jgi:non-ribosomal peptide synthetase component F
MANLKNCTKLQLIGVMYVWLFGVAIVLLARWLYVRLQLNRDLSLLYVLFRVKRKQAEYLRRRTTVADLFEAQADLNAQRVCVLSADNNGAQLTFAQHDELANRVAHWALAQGLKKGDVVALLLENCLEYTAIWLGLAKLGVVSALINTQTRGQSLLKSLGMFVWCSFI